MQDKLLSMLGMAKKAGKLTEGYDLAVQAIRGGNAMLAVSAEDVSDKTFKNLKYEADKAGVPIAKLQISMKELGEACKTRAGVMALVDKGFAQAVLKQLEKENAFYDDEIPGT